jgi:RHS repeat-associated protein
LLIYEINNSNANDFATLFIPDVKSFTDYDPFGMLVPERFEQSVDYRYGFQGQEEDNEIKGEGNSLNYTFRMHDPRVGRFFARDPLTSIYPYLTPYQFAGNRPIDGNDLEGKEWAAKSSEKTNSDGSITITTSIVIKMKVINKSSEITSPAPQSLPTLRHNKKTK